MGDAAKVPRTTIRFFREASGEVPVLTWFREMRRKDPRGYSRCVARVELLAQMGYELRRPIADTVREGIHELRARSGHVNYRILYFFHGRDVAILAHVATKDLVIPEIDFERALARRKALVDDPEKHIAEAETS